MTGQLRPRAAVIADAWERAHIEAPAFVNSSGQPLARTTKCLLDPLVIRPRVNKNLASALLSADDGEHVLRLVAAAKETIETASRWYLLLRAHRTRAGITEGNPQELYFPRAFELATQHGLPGGGAEGMCEEMLAEIHDAAQPAVDELIGLLADPEMDRHVRSRWAADWSGHLGEVAIETVAHAVADSLHDAEGPAFAAFLDSTHGNEIGLAMRREPGVVSTLLAAAGRPRPEVQVAADDPVTPPALRGQADLPLDRTLEQRARAALRRHREAFSTISAEDLIEDETERALSGFGLLARDAQALFLMGIVVAAALDPLGRHVVEPLSRPRLVADLLASLRKAAYVMHLRRELADGRAIHPQQEGVVAELADFWRPWLSRLWVRLHGRDVTQTPVADGAVELLTGITRSVMLDHRHQIRLALEKAAG